MSRRNYLIGLVLLTFWTVMTVLLLRREVFLPKVSPSDVPPVSERPAGDSWMGIYSRNDSGGEDRIGYVHLRNQPGTRGGETGTRFGMTLKLSTTMLSMPAELLLDGNAWVTDRRGLSDFEFRISSFGENEIRASGGIQDGKLKLDVETAGETYPISLPVGSDVLVQPNFASAPLNLPTLEVGDEIYVDAFDPMTLSQGTARVTCVGTEAIEFDGERIATKILETELGGVTTKTWVTLDEQVMRVETPLGLVLKRISQREALEEVAPGDAKEIIRAAAVHPTGARPFRGATEMRFRVADLPPQLDIPSDGLQRQVGASEYLISAAMPPDGTESDPTGLEEYLGGDPFVQTQHRRIAARAAEIVGDAVDPWEKAQRIYEWVYQRIDKVPVLALPSALEVLDSGEGDCNEHTVLFTALARNQGIPTRMAIGLVWSDDLDGFYYHAWPEVFVGHWVPMDPTLGQPIADATHIKLLEGSIEQWPRLTPFIGQVSIDVLEVH